MVQVTLFLLVLSLALVAPSFCVEKCNLTGEWISDLNEIITIWPVDEEGRFEGIYRKEIPSLLEGVQCRMKQNNETIFGFTLYPRIIVSNRVFTGHCFISETGKEVLKTIWLELSGFNNREPITVGTSDFTRFCWQKHGGIIGNCKADRSARHTKPVSCPTTCF